MLEDELKLTPYFFSRKIQGVRYVSRLGGGRSILLSYWCVRFVILPKFFLSVKKIRHFFCFGKHILSGSAFEGR